MSGLGHFADSRVLVLCSEMEHFINACKLLLSCDLRVGRRGMELRETISCVGP